MLLPTTDITELLERVFGVFPSKRQALLLGTAGGWWLSTRDEMGRRYWINSVTGQRTYNKAEAVNPTGSFVGPAASPAMGAATNPLAGPAVGPVNPMLAPVFPAQGNPYAMQNPMPGYGAQYPYQGGYMTQGGYTTQGAYPAGVAYPAGSIAPVNLGGIQPQNLNGNNVNGQNVNHAYWPNGSGS